MGASKQSFMDQREIEELNFAEQLAFEEKGEKLSTVQLGLNAMPELIDLEIQQFENGDISSLDLAIKFRGYMDKFKSLSEKMDEWIVEKRISISDEADKYPEGYHGYKIYLQSRETPNYKHIAKWIELEKAKKDFEEKCKLAFKLVQKGGLNVDESGEEIPLPIIKTTSFIKFDTVKK
ncbi:hypothetical protein [Chryseobacterium sp.]|uniref:hypothetical protein n=1 Tax=Chryseobacterium sp. TaxID=1871047 RepID=UPI003219E6D7